MGYSLPAESSFGQRNKEVVYGAAISAYSDRTQSIRTVAANMDEKPAQMVVAGIPFPNHHLCRFFCMRTLSGHFVHRNTVNKFQKAHVWEGAFGDHGSSANGHRGIPDWWGSSQQNGSRPCRDRSYTAVQNGVVLEICFRDPFHLQQPEPGVSLYKTGIICYNGK